MPSRRARIHATQAAVGPTLLALLALCPGALAGEATSSQDSTPDPVPEDQDAITISAGSDQAFVEVTAARREYYVHEPIRLQLRFGFERRFFDESMIQLFHKELDVPAQVLAHWTKELDGAVLLDAAPSPAASGTPLRTFALDDGIATARELEDRIVDGRRFKVLELERSYLPRRPGELVIRQPALRFAYATEFREDSLGGRVAVNRRDALVHGRPLKFLIHALPEEGRPFDFTGAVGRYTVRARAEPREVDVGESFRLTLSIEGAGNFGYFEAPRLDALADFHVYGTMTEEAEGREVVTYDLAARSAEVEGVPSIPFTYFHLDAPPGYRTVYTEAIPLVVRPLPVGPDARSTAGDGAGRAVAGINDIFDLKPTTSRASGDRAGPSRLGTATALLGPWLLALGLVALRRARSSGRTDPEGTRALAAAGAFAARVDDEDSDVSAMLAEYLAARLRCSAAAVIGHDLARRLAGAGISDELATRAAALLEHLVHARFGGAPHDDAAAAAGELVDALETGFRGAR